MRRGLRKRADVWFGIGGRPIRLCPVRGVE